MDCGFIFKLFNDDAIKGQLLGSDGKFFIDLEMIFEPRYIGWEIDDLLSSTPNQIIRIKIDRSKMNA